MLEVIHIKGLPEIIFIYKDYFFRTCETNIIDPINSNLELIESMNKKINETEFVKVGRDKFDFILNNFDLYKVNEFFEIEIPFNEYGKIIIENVL